MTHKRFPTVGSTVKVPSPVVETKPLKFPTTKSAAAASAPFDLDGSETIYRAPTPRPVAKQSAKPAVVTVDDSVDTTVPLLRRPPKPVPAVEPKKAVKAKAVKAAAKPARAKGEKPAMAPRKANAVPEITAPVVITKATEVAAKPAKVAPAAKVSKAVAKDVSQTEAAAKPATAVKKAKKVKLIKPKTVKADVPAKAVKPAAKPKAKAAVAAKPAAKAKAKK